jgi:aspartyl-tRNA(Asn)/glutamyl-tRNA(Gln) amidotransferase subunit A
LGAFVTLFEKEARDAADQADRDRNAGRRRGPLHGIPVAVKDLADIEGSPTGFGSRAYAKGLAEKDAEFVSKLRHSGLILLGKTHQVEFAFGSWGTNHALGTPLNPLDRKVPRIAGGSSSGSAVAVAADMVPLAIGSDTGGSVRIPASLCGIVGLKTSAGLVSNEGVASLSHTFDTIGPLAKSVEGAALALGALTDTSVVLDSSALFGAKIAVLDEAQLGLLDSAVAEGLSNTVKILESAGIKLSTFRFPLEPTEIQRRNGGIMAYEAYANLRYLVDDEDQPLDPYVRQRVKQGAAISAAEYEELLAERYRDMAKFSAAFEGFDCLLLPSTPQTATPVSEVDENKIPMSRLTRAGNYYGLCGLSLPYWQQVESLPVGIQILMRGGGDARLLSVGLGIESLLPRASPLFR